jgi:hypothetical protein
MTASASLHSTLWLVRDTFRQAWSSGVSWVMGALTAVAVVVCLILPLNAPHTAREVERVLAGWVGQGAGVLLALVLTAGLLPSFLEAQASAVLQAKPVGRRTLLVGKCLGATALVAGFVSLFVGGTWLALATRSGDWDSTYLLCAPLMLLHFAVFFGFSAMMAVMTRSTAASIFGTVLFWLLCWAMNFGRHAELLTLGPNGAPPMIAWAVEAGYWTLPKPLDFQIVAMLPAPAADSVPLLDVTRLADRGAWAPGWSLASSAVWGLLLVCVAAHDFNTADY